MAKILIKIAQKLRCFFVHFPYLFTIKFLRLVDGGGHGPQKPPLPTPLLRSIAVASWCVVAGDPKNHFRTEQRKISSVVMCCERPLNQFCFMHLFSALYSEVFLTHTLSKTHVYTHRAFVDFASFRIADTFAPVFGLRIG